MTDENGNLICRVCRKADGKIIRGAHRKCRNLEERQRRAAQNGRPIDTEHRQPARPPKPKHSQKLQGEFSRRPESTPPIQPPSIPFTLPPKAPQVWGRRNKYGMDGWD